MRTALLTAALLVATLVPGSSSADVASDAVPDLPALPPPSEGGGAAANAERDEAATAEDDAAPGSGDELSPASTTDAKAPAVRYAAMTAKACEAALLERGVRFVKTGPTKGVVDPVRLTAPIRGVSFHSMLPPSQRKTSPYEIYDCRLVLALDDFAALLAKHEVVDVVHYSVYRPPPKKWPEGTPGKRHGAALAIDAATFKKKDGTVLNVEKDFHGRVGRRPCGKGATLWPATPQAKELRAIVCETADARLFNVALTPGYNWQHRNHLHLELTPKVQWILVR
ncbi:MAG: extensin family protein [Polyangiaceae bacterium]